MRRLLLLLLAASSLGFVGRGGVPCDAVEAQPQCLVALLPGPTADTLEILELEGGFEPSAGELLLTTVSVQPNLGLRDWIRGSFDDRVDHIDRDILYPPGTTVQQVREANEVSMQQSQIVAILAAFVHLGYEDIFAGAEVVDVTEFSAAADGRLRAGDVIVEAAGSRVQVRADLGTITAQYGVGDVVELVVDRGGELVEVAVPLVESPESGRPVFGIVATDAYDLPVDVNIDAGEIGGPSAGLAFALAIIDALDPADLTGGRIIASTGEIDVDGTVKPIGGIRQKVLGAINRRADEDGNVPPPATVFLVPTVNFAEARTTPVTSEIMLVPVADLAEAVQALADLRADRLPAGAVTLTP